MVSYLFIFFLKKIRNMMGEDKRNKEFYFLVELISVSAFEGHS